MDVNLESIAPVITPVLDFDLSVNVCECQTLNKSPFYLLQIGAGTDISEEFISFKENLRSQMSNLKISSYPFKTND